MLWKCRVQNVLLDCAQAWIYYKAFSPSERASSIHQWKPVGTHKIHHVSSPLSFPVL